MKIFALQTNVHTLRKKYTIQEEEVLLTTHLHWIAFFVHTYKQLFFSAVALLISVQLLTYDIIPDIYLLGSIAGWLVIFMLIILKGYIRYRLNFLIVTSEKVLLVEQHFLFSQRVNPMHLDAIVSTDVESQFFGLFRCGRVIINLTERTAYSSKQVVADYLPRPNDVAGIIENAIVLDKNKKVTDSGVDAQQHEIDDLQKQADAITNES